MTSCGVASSQVDQLPPPPHHSAAIVSDAGEPTSASQVDLEAQLPPPPPPTDDPPATLLEKVLPVVLQLMTVFTGGPTTRNQGHELEFKLYHLAVVTIYGFDIILVICLVERFAGIDRPWVRKTAIPLISGVLALSVATAVLRTVIDLLP